MLEIFVIYNKTTGYIDGGAGRIDRKKELLLNDLQNPDESTVTASIERILAKDPDRKVVYLDNQPVPNPEKHKIKDERIVDMTSNDKITLEDARPKTELKILQEKVAALEAAQ